MPMRLVTAPKTDEPLFVEGLGLDSIDALELALAIERRWGVKFGADEDVNREAFKSIRTLSEFITTRKSLNIPEPNPDKNPKNP